MGTNWWPSWPKERSSRPKPRLSFRSSRAPSLRPLSRRGPFLWTSWCLVCPRKTSSRSPTCLTRWTCLSATPTTFSSRLPFRFRPWSRSFSILLPTLAPPHHHHHHHRDLNNSIIINSQSFGVRKHHHQQQPVSLGGSVAKPDTA